jgi:hypothetical protein
VVITARVQRWRERVGSYRPAGETFAPLGWEVAAMDSDREARAFVVAHHYSASYPAARRRFGLYAPGGCLAGVAVCSVPMHPAVLRPFPVDTSVELGRFVLLDGVRGNGETWFLARCLDLLRREGFVGVVSHADPMQRTDASGARVFGGHVGTIYQASNAIYDGRTRPATQRLLPDGRVFSARAASKIRSGERGREYAAAELVRHGARPMLDGEDAAAWLREALGAVTRAARHPGQHRYLLALDRRARRLLPEGLPYPKVSAGTPARGLPVAAVG